MAVFCSFRVPFSNKKKWNFLSHLARQQNVGKWEEENRAEWCFICESPLSTQIACILNVRFDQDLSVHNFVAYLTLHISACHSRVPHVTWCERSNVAAKRQQMDLSRNYRCETKGKHKRIKVPKGNQWQVQIFPWKKQERMTRCKQFPKDFRVNLGVHGQSKIRALKTHSFPSIRHGSWLLCFTHWTVVTSMNVFVNTLVCHLCPLLKCTFWK